MTDGKPKVQQSLGLIETWGMVPAVEAADAATKAADVVFFHWERVEAGLVTVMFAGDVATVQAAVAAGKAAAERVGRVVSAHVIPRPDRQVPWRPPSPEEPKSAGVPPDESQPSALEKAPTEGEEGPREAEPQAPVKKAAKAAKPSTGEKRKPTKGRKPK